MRCILKIFVFLLWAAAIGIPVSVSALEKVSLQLVWKNQFQFAGYYVAKELGYYADLGLDVDIREYEFGIDVTRDVLSQDAHFGVGRSSLIIERMEGKPVFLLAAIYQHSPFMLLAKSRDDLKEVSDLKGKRIMVPDDVVGMASMNAMLTSNRIEPENYIVQKHTFNIDDLIEGKTDAISAYISNEPFQMEKLGVDYTIFSPRDYGFDFYSDILFTSKKMYDERPELVKRFHEASLKGWEYAFENIEQTVELIIKKYNSQDKTRKALRYEGQALKDLAYEKDVDLGHIDSNRVNQIAQVYNLLGLTKQFEPLENLIYKPPSDFNFQSIRKVIGLTKHEEVWLKNHPVIRVHNEKDWAPFNFIEDSTPKGFSIDYMNLLASKIGVKLQYITGPEWDEFISMMKNNRLDVMLNIARSPERDNFFSFTPAYVTMMQALFTRRDYPLVYSIKDLYGKTFAVPKGFYLQEVLKSYPEIEIFEVANVTEAIYAVSNGRADALFDLMPVVNYVTEKQQVTNLKVGGDIGIVEGKPIPLHIGVSKENALLADILTKTMKAVTPEELNIIQKRWMPAASKNDDFNLFAMLSDNEIKWLSRHREFKLGTDPAWPPFEFYDDKGQYSGIGSSYTKVVQERLGVKMIPLKGLTWSQVIDKAKAGEIDILPAAMRTPAREEFLTFTEPYISLPMIIASRKGGPFVDSLSDLKGYKVGVVKGYASIDLIQADYPAMKLSPYETLSKGLEELNTGKIDFFIDNLGAITYAIDRKNLTNIKIAAPTKYHFELSMAVRKDWPEMVGILNKTLDSISDSDRSNIKNTWMALEVKFGFDLKTILVWALPLSGSVILIIVFVMVWNRRLGREIETRKSMQADLVKLNEDAALHSSELQKANMELSEREEIFQSITSAALSAIIMVNNDGDVLFWNKAAESIFGWTREEITGKDLNTLLNPPQFQKTYISAFNLFRNSGKGAAVNKIVELSAIRKDGENFPVEISLSAVNLKGKWCAIGIVNDISERQKSQQALQQSDYQNKVIIENSPLGIVHLNKEGKILRFNNNAVELFGTTSEKLTGYDVLKHLKNQSFKQALMTALSGRVATYEGKYTSVTGSKTCFLRGIFNPIDKGTSSTEVIGTFEDISERTRMEREMKRNLEDLEQFSKVAVGREEKMILLKQEINELLKLTGKSKKYEIVS